MSEKINCHIDNYDWEENTLQSDFVKYIPTSEKLNCTIPLEKAQKLLVNLPVEDDGNCDGYIKNLTRCTVDINKH